MSSYFYPTKSPLFEARFEKWKRSGREYLVFPFLKCKPSTLPKNKSQSFWLYLYFSKARTVDKKLQMLVKFRVRVVSYSFDIISDDNAFICDDFVDEPKAWFKCDVVEEIKNANGNCLNYLDFKTRSGKDLRSSVRRSIAPIEDLSNFIAVEFVVK